LHLDVSRDRNALYRELSSGEIENVYTLRLLNKSRSSQSFRIEISGMGGAVLETDPALPELGPGAVGSIIARVRVNPDNLEPGVRDVIFTARQTGGEQSEASHEARFFVPPRRVELQ
jgi:polyferredoxin